MGIEVIGSVAGGVARPEHHPSTDGIAQRGSITGAQSSHAHGPGETGVGGDAGIRDIVPAEPPQGADPELWSMLTPEERAFFARAWLMGPVTYGPGASTSPWPQVHLGGRIDMRV
jgi:hypothetical protein